jgi:hypothetical protein
LPENEYPAAAMFPAADFVFRVERFFSGVEFCLVLIAFATGSTIRRQMPHCLIFSQKRFFSGLYFFLSQSEREIFYYIHEAL